MAKKSTAQVRLGSAVVPARLESFIKRIENLEEEQAALASDKRDIYSEAKGVGYDIKTMRKVVALRKMDAADRAEQETLLDVYLHALGMVDRVEARVASGEPVTKAAKAEGVPRSTFYRVSQKRASVGNGTPTETPEVQPADGGTGTAEVTSSPAPAAVDSDFGNKIKQMILEKGIKTPEPDQGFTGDATMPDLPEHLDRRAQA